MESPRWLSMAAVAMATLCGLRLTGQPASSVDVVRDIRPLFQTHCHSCHGPDKDKGGFSLATRSRAMEGGDTGPALLPGNSAASPLAQRINSSLEDQRMPPKGERLSPAQIRLIQTWIDRGAPWPDQADEPDPQKQKAADHWSFRR